jgi:hypothetical protein
MNFIKAPPISRVLNYHWPLPYHIQQLVADSLKMTTVISASSSTSA